LAAEPGFAALDHIEFYTSDVERSRDFFVRIFGNTLKIRGTKRYVRVGSSYIAFEPPRGNAGPGTVDHFSVSVKQLDMPRLHAFLEERGVAYRDYPSGRDTGITDDDGIRTQLSPENGWSVLTPPGFADESVDVADTPVFRPMAIDHLLLNVSDRDRAIAFYQRFLGAPVERSERRIWFQAGASRVGVLKTPDGERAGVRQFGLVAARFPLDAAVERLQRLGARDVAGSVDTPGAVVFRDPDGLRIQVAGI
jgi:catechol 2,3-dioxygenase-like lactoylglutathione lyase family enzyme